MNILDIVNTFFYHECEQEIQNKPEFKKLKVSMIPKRYSVTYEKNVWHVNVVLPIEDSTDIITIERAYSMETIEAVLPMIMNEEIPEFCFFEIGGVEQVSDPEPE